MVQDVQVSVPAGLRSEPVVWADLVPLTFVPAGRIAVDCPGVVVDVFDTQLNRVSRDRAEVSLMPGLYQLALRGPEDPYYSQIKDVAVQSMKRSEIRILELGPSTRLRLDEAQALLDRTEKKIKLSRGFGWTLLAAGVSSFAGSFYSYLQVQTATDGYNDAQVTSEAQAYRDDIKQWGTILGVSAGIGTGSAVLGGYFLRKGADGSKISLERAGLQKKVKELSDQAAVEASGNPLFGRSAK
jgi:hypothetical protein